MSVTTYTMEMPAAYMQSVFGQNDKYIRKLETDFHVTVVDRNGAVKITGEEAAVRKSVNILSRLFEVSENGGEIEEQKVDYAISLGREEKEGELVEMDKDLICHTISGKPVKPKTLGQKQYADAIRGNMIVFGLGPAGTGKTYLAMAMAVTA